MLNRHDGFEPVGKQIDGQGVGLTALGEVLLGVGDRLFPNTWASHACARIDQQNAIFAWIDCSGLLNKGFQIGSCKGEG